MTTTIYPQPECLGPRRCESLAHPTFAEAPPSTHLVYSSLTDMVITTVYLCGDCAASLAWELGQRERSAA